MITELYDRIVIGDGSALPVLHLNQNVLSVWVIDNDVDLLVFLAAAEVANGGCLLVVERCDMLILSPFQARCAAMITDKLIYANMCFRMLRLQRFCCKISFQR